MSSLNILVSGRLLDFPEIMKITLKIIHLFSSLHPTCFYFMDEPTFTKIRELYPTNESAFYRIFNQPLHCKLIDYVVTIGGDGTILYVAKEFLETTPPFLTFYQGTLGFLCKFQVEELQKTIQSAVRSRITPTEENLFKVSSLMRIQVFIKIKHGTQTIAREKHVLLNEIAITRKNNQSIKLDIMVDDEFITTTSGDGLLISTPTGSTAYALSSGGPIIVNGVDCITLVPIAPNSLSFRPICLPQTSIIKIKLSNSSKSTCIASFDGQSFAEILHDDLIEIKYTEGHNLMIYEPKKTENSESMPTWMERLKLYLGWNEVFKPANSEKLGKKMERIEMMELQQTGDK